MHQLRRYRNIVVLCLLVVGLALSGASRAQDETSLSDTTTSEAPPTETPEIETPSTPISDIVGPTLPSGEPLYGNSLDAPVPAFATQPATPGKRFHLSLALNGGYDDNANSGRGSQGGSAFVNGSLAMRYDLLGPRTKITIEGGGSVTDYFDRPNSGGVDYSGHIRLDLSHRVSDRMTLGANLYATYTAEPNFNLNLGINRRVGSYFYSTGGLTLEYLWTPRFSTRSNYIFGTFFQEGQNNPANGGLSNIGNTQDRIENTFSNEFRWLLWPTTTGLVDYRLGFINYENNSAFNSISNSLLVGFEHSFSPRLHASLRGGVEYRSYEGRGDSLSPTFEGSVNYLIAARTAVTWFANYGLESASTIGSAQRTSFRTGLNGRYAWTARISSSLAFIYEHDDFGNNGSGIATAGPSFSEDTINVNLSTRYAITRYLGLQAGYNFTDVMSDQAFLPYTRNRFTAGVDFTF